MVQQIKSSQVKLRLASPLRTKFHSLFHYNRDHFGGGAMVEGVIELQFAIVRNFQARVNLFHVVVCDEAQHNACVVYAVCHLLKDIASQAL